MMWRAAGVLIICSLMIHDFDDFQTKPDLSGVMVAVSADQQSLSQLQFIFYNQNRSDIDKYEYPD